MWWKTFYDPSESNWLFRHNSMGGLWTVGWLLALCCLVGVLGPTALPYLALPTALCGLYIFLSYVTGVAGMAILTPLMAYGWLCLGWFLAYGYPVVGNLAAQLEGLLVALLMVVFLIAAPHVYAKLLIPVVAEGFFYACLAWGIFWLIAPEPELLANHAQLEQLLRRMIDFYFVGVNVISGIVLVIVVWGFVRSLPQYPEARRQLVLDAQLFGAGCVLTLVAALPARLQPVLGVVVLVVGYVALAVYALREHAEQVAWALVPLVLLGTLAVVAAAPTDYLPSYGPATAVVLAIHDGPLGAGLQAIVMPLLDGLASLLGAPAAWLVHAGMQLLSWFGARCRMIIEPLVVTLAGTQTAISELDAASVNLAWQMTELPQDSLLTGLLCLYLGVFVLSVVMGSIMGVADVKAAEGVGDASETDGTKVATSAATLPRWLTTNVVSDVRQRLGRGV